MFFCPTNIQLITKVLLAFVWKLQLSSIIRTATPFFRGNLLPSNKRQKHLKLKDHSGMKSLL